MIVVNSFMDSLRNSLSKGSRGVAGTGGFFWHQYLKVSLKSSKRSSSKHGRSKGWKPSFGSSGSGKGLSKDDMGLALAEKTS